MWFFSLIDVVFPLVVVGLVVLAVLRPRPRQTLVLVGLALCVLGLIPELPGISTALARALYHPTFPYPDSGSIHRPSNAGYYLVFGLARLSLVVGVGLFGWATLAPSAPASGRGSRQVPAGQWAGAAQQAPWTPSGWSGTADWTPAAQAPGQRPVPRQDTQAISAPAGPSWPPLHGVLPESRQQEPWQPGQAQPAQPWQQAQAGAPQGQPWQSNVPVAAPQGQSWQAGPWQGQPVPQDRADGWQQDDRQQGGWHQGERQQDDWQRGR